MKKNITNDYWRCVMAYKTLMSGLDRIFKFDNYLVFEYTIDLNAMIEQRRIESLVHFCTTGKFLDER